MIQCQQCGGRMLPKKQSSGNCAGLLLAIIVLVVGIVLIIMIPVIGWVIGGLMVLLSLFMGGKRTKVWRCSRCRAIVARG